MWKLQGGSYIPGVSGIGHQVGLAKDVHGSLQGLDKGKESRNKYRSNLQTAGGWGKDIFGKIAGFAGKKGLDMLTKTAFGTSPLGMLVGVGGKMFFDRAMKHGGGEAMKGLAKKFGFAKAPEIAARGKFGLHTDEYKKLSEAPDKIESELTGASEGEALGGLSLNEMWRNLPGGKESAAGVLEGAKTQAKNLLFNRDALPGAEQITDLTGTGLGRDFDFGDMPGQLTEDLSWYDKAPEAYLARGQQGGYMQGYQEGGPTKTKSKTIRGASPVEYSYDDPDVLKLLMSVPASQVGEGEGLRYYLGEKPHGSMPNLDRQMAQLDARQKMAFAPQDSIPSHMVENYFDKPSKLKGLKSLLGIGKQMGGMMPGGVSNALPYQQGGEAEDKLTFGQRFVKRFPSQHEDPERAAGQERGLTSLIDFLIPQSKLDVALSALPIGALGKVGKKGIKKLIKGKRSPYNEGRTNVDMQHYTDWPENVKDDIHPSILDDVLPPRRRALGDIYDEECRTLDLVDILESHGLQEGGYMPRYNLGGSVQQQPMAYQLGGLLKYKRSPMMG